MPELKITLHRISGDKRLNPRLQAQVQALRTGMGDLAVKKLKPESNYRTARHHKRPALVISDRRTKRKYTCPLFAASEVLEALEKLHP